MFTGFIARRTALAALNLALSFSGFWGRSDLHTLARKVLEFARDSLTEVESGRTSAGAMLAAWDAFGVKDSNVA